MALRNIDHQGNNVSILDGANQHFTGHWKYRIIVQSSLTLEPVKSFLLLETPGLTTY